MGQNLKFGHFCYLSDLVHSLGLFKVLYFAKLLPSSLYLNLIISEIGWLMWLFLFSPLKRDCGDDMLHFY